MSTTILAHERFGNGPELVIVLHEFFGNLRTWDPVRAYLNTARFQYVFADVRGYGGSRRMKGEFTAAEIAEDARALATSLGAERYHLIGHSMTGLAVQHALVHDSKKRIQKVVAVTPVPTDGFEADADTQAFFRRTITDDATFDQAVQGLTGQRWDGAFVSFKRAQNRSSSDPEVMKAYLERMIFPGGFAAAAQNAQVDTPLLVVAGAHDFPGMRLADLQRSMGDAFSGVQWHELIGAGHYPMDESPV
ncbi:MAG: alpha/beta fold hydrolase, partial [Myxococcota bacterium]